MEKKTIGKFIAALRKANGITQKELGEKLFVSDKTISRWECDECTPELSLLPSIAEIFDITIDELLRGERNNPNRETTVNEETANKQKTKSSKQFKLMLDQRTRKYKNLTLISIGITIFGFIAAMIANLGFSKGLIAFCLATAFCVASEICQIAFAINTRIIPDEDDNAYTDKIQNTNTNTVKTAIVVSLINIALFTFCLPLVTLIDGANYGLTFTSWCGYGLLFASIVLVVCYVLYTLFIRKALIKKNVLFLTEKQTNELAKNNKLLKKCFLLFATIALGVCVCIGVWNIIGWKALLKEYTFDNCADFKAFMESDYNRWFNETYGYANVNGEIIEIAPNDPNYSHNAINHKFINASITNFNGEEICSYYYNPDLYWAIDFTPSADDKMPVTVITWDAVEMARDIFFAVEITLCALIAVDFIAVTSAYLIKIQKNKNHT